MLGRPGRCWAQGRGSVQAGVRTLTLTTSFLTTAGQNRKSTPQTASACSLLRTFTPTSSDTLDELLLPLRVLGAWGCVCRVRAGQEQWVQKATWMHGTKPRNPCMPCTCWPITLPSPCPTPGDACDPPLASRGHSVVEIPNELWPQN